MSELFKHPITVLFRGSHLNTDVFLMLSGFLVAHSVIKKSQKGEKIKFANEIFNRYTRLIPNVAFLTIFMIFIFPILGSGPLWPMLIDYQANLCRQTWWRNILMMQNLMDFDEICMMHTHHIATDFQLSMFGPVITAMIIAFPILMTSLVVGAVFGIALLKFVKSYYEDVVVFIAFQVR